MANKEVAFKIVVDTSEVGEGVEKSVKSVEELGYATKKTGDQMKSGFKAAEKERRAEEREIQKGLLDLEQGRNTAARVEQQRQLVFAELLKQAQDRLEQLLSRSDAITCES